MDKPWLFRTYAGHSTAKATNELFRTNLSKGQTGLSVAFDLPTQTGYDSDHPMARGEVGRVGVPVSHIGDMRVLFEGMQLAGLNTSMTINATAPWLLSLYIAVADEQGADRKALQGTTQNDVTKEYLARGTYIFPPEPALRMTTDMIAFAAGEMPKFNPVNICSYHLQEAGATPEQEISIALATAATILDETRARPGMTQKEFERIAGRISFFVNAGIRFITEMCKMLAFTELWDEMLATRYGVTDASQRRFRYGVQVNSLGLTEQQPENNVYRILLEMLGVTLSKNARARAVQLPAWNEAIGLPRPWDQQWSLRMQQILAYETDLLEYEDLFEHSPVVRAKVDSLKQRTQKELSQILADGGVSSLAVLTRLKQQLVDSNARRIARIESGETKVVGVNVFTNGDPSPLQSGDAPSTVVVTHDVEDTQISNLRKWRKSRSQQACDIALAGLQQAARSGENIMPASVACAKAGVTTGEWAGTLRGVFGEFVGPTGVTLDLSARPEGDDMAAILARLSESLGEAPRFLMAKPGLDGHSNGAEQVAKRAADCGMHVIYKGIRQTVDAILADVAAERAHVVGLSILSGNHVSLARDIMHRLREAGFDHVPVVVGGIIPDADINTLKQLGVKRVYSPKHFELDTIIKELLMLVENMISVRQPGTMAN